MSELYELEQQLLSLRELKVNLEKERALYESPTFKRVVLGDFCEAESKRLVSELANATSSESSAIMNKLTGISTFNSHIQRRIFLCNNIDSQIQQVEDMINEHIESHGSN